MVEINREAYFWKYLSTSQKSLIEEGLYLLSDLQLHPDSNISDYSYIVFPFAKAYEGFLKQFFLDLGFISSHDYESDHFRIGRALNPQLEKRLRHFSVYDKIKQHCGGRDLADQMWSIWKRGRNLVFHYFPHNFRALTIDEAEEICREILEVIEKSVNQCQLKKFKL